MSDENRPQGPSRRHLLVSGAAAAAGVAAVAAGGVAHAAPPAADGIPTPGSPVKATDGGQFRDALRKLGGDTAFRNSMTADPVKLLDGTAGFKLSMQDLRTLRNAAVLSGVDLTEIDKVFAKSELSPITAGGGDVTACCCCCCCGQAAAEIRFHGA